MNAPAEHTASPAATKVNGLVERSLQALEEFRALNQEQVDYIIAKSLITALDKHDTLTMHAVGETRRGMFEDKVTKNLFACESAVHRLHDLKTVGVIGGDDVTDITEIAGPVRVTCDIVPITNPTSTATFKSLIALKTRSPVIFSFHPSAQQCSTHTAQVVRDAAVTTDMLEGCIQWIGKPSMGGTPILIKHPDVTVISAADGDTTMEAAYSYGKPALGIEAGSVPAYVEKTTDIQQAVHDIMTSKASDNNMACTSERTVTVGREIHKKLVEEFKSHGVYLVNKKEKAVLEDFIFNVTVGHANCGGARSNSVVMGRPTAWIVERAGFKVPEETDVTVAECYEVDPSEPLTRGKLLPVLAMLKADSTEQGLQFVEQMVAFNDLGHSAAIRTAD